MTTKEKALYLMTFWGLVFSQEGFGSDSDINEFNEIMNLIARNGGFDPDEPEQAMIGDLQVFEEFRALWH